MPLLNITLDCGIQVYVAAFHQLETHEAGQIIGKRSSERNQRVLKSMAMHAQQLYPHKPVVTLRPETVRHSSGLEEFLPPITCITLLVSEVTVNDPIQHGSSLVTLHLQGNLYPHFSEENYRKVQQLNWNELAADFMY